MMNRQASTIPAQRDPMSDIVDTVNVVVEQGLRQAGPRTKRMAAFSVVCDTKLENRRRWWGRCE